VGHGCGRERGRATEGRSCAACKSYVRTDEGCDDGDMIVLLQKPLEKASVMNPVGEAWRSNRMLSLQRWKENVPPA
jgi:hypothetical protein